MRTDIQWFPGHMAKAQRLTAESVKAVDAVIYVLDARAPYSCLNPHFNEILGSKPVIYILNKSDLADQKVTAEWVGALSKSGAAALSASASRGIGRQNIERAVITGAKEKTRKWAQKGLKYTPKAMVVGIPNTGKSTVINMLCGDKKTRVADRPGVTRGKQWVRAGQFDLLDTPGVLPPKIENQTVARHLAYLGSVKDTVIDIEMLARELAEELAAKFGELLISRYNIDIQGSGAEILERIARKKGLIIKGGSVDLQRASEMLLDDFRRARIGKISLERPEESAEN